MRRISPERIFPSLDSKLELPATLASATVLNNTMNTKSVALLQEIRGWLEEETGMDFSGNRLSRLRDVLKNTGSRELRATDLDELLKQWRSQPRELNDFVANLTVGETFFFRNEHHFRLLREEIIPEILRENRDREEIRAWSAGCATGEEPYSLAILLEEMLGRQSDWRFSILGTDLNPSFLDRAREGCYRQWSFRQTEIHHNRSYFLPRGDLYQLDERFRRHVRFACLNLVKDVYPSPLTGTLGLDLILFRNVAIYLKSEVTEQILARFHAALRPGGWLLLGETEVSSIAPGEFEVFRFEQATFFRKKGGQWQGESESVPPQPILTQRPSLESLLKIPKVPALPEWVELPRPRSSAASFARPEKDQQRPIPSKPGGKDCEERLNRSLEEQNIPEVTRLLSRIRDPKERAQLRLRCIRFLLAAAQLQQARTMLESCLVEAPLMMEAQLLKAAFAEEDGDLAEAERCYRRGIYIDPLTPMPHFHLAMVLHNLGNETAATRSLMTAYKLVSSSDPLTQVPYGEGICHGRLAEMLVLIKPGLEE
jgi:chemotaxis protein methyltransferase CheR